jgi:hypothetical protein
VVAAEEGPQVLGWGWVLVAGVTGLVTGLGAAWKVPLEVRAMEVEVSQVVVMVRG